MIQKRLFWHFYFSFLLLVLFSLAIVSVFSFIGFRFYFLSSVENNLNNQAVFVKNLISEEIKNGQYDKIDQLSKQIGNQTNTRITVILADGTVIADSTEDPQVMENHSDRPEILRAQIRGSGTATRYSSTLKHNLMYVAILLKQNNETFAFIRTSMEVDHINQTLRWILVRIGQLGLAIVIIIAVISFVVSRRISEPIEKMKSTAEQFATGKLDTTIELPKTKELRALAVSLNKMAMQLNDRIQTVTQQKNELQAVLSSMAEGVVAVDAQARIISMNTNAIYLLNIDVPNIEKRNVEEVIRDSKIQQFINDALESTEPVTMELASGEKREKHLHIYGRKLNNSEDNDSGAIIVINDVTKLRQLENIRRDFVANVSHELKTPITSIKGFVETLLDGAVDNKEDAKRFLTIIARHTDRLNAIIEDLLILCRIQEDSEATRVNLELANIKDCIKAAVETCSIKAKNKKVEIKINAQDINCQIDPFLIEQAMVNLIDNAIKYSDPEKTIQINTQQTENHIIISVEDNGFGISREHLERIFERFYVTDKARSRTLGGTGLGLSIVKHICQAHGGSVEVKSQLGKGSTFSISLPKK